MFLANGKVDLTKRCYVCATPYTAQEIKAGEACFRCMEGDPDPDLYAYNDREYENYMNGSSRFPFPVGP
jgi:hypothetical protein